MHPYERPNTWTCIFLYYNRNMNGMLIESEFYDIYLCALRKGSMTGGKGRV